MKRTIAELTGEDLYRMWATNMLKHNCEVDQWVELDEPDRKAWEMLAVDLDKGTPDEPS